MLPFPNKRLPVLQKRKLLLHSSVTAGFVVRVLDSPFYRTIRRIVIGICRPSTSIQLSLKPSLVALDVLHLISQFSKTDLVFRYIGNRSRANVNADRATAGWMNRFSGRCVSFDGRLAFQRQLSVPVIDGFSGCSKNPHILDALRQHLCFIRILRVKFQRKPQSVPLDIRTAEDNFNAAALSGF